MGISAHGVRLVNTSLWRTSVVALFIALAGNVLLYRISGDDDWFANVIAITSAIAALGLIVARYVRSLTELALGLSFIIWAANAIEFATEDAARWESQVRQCAFYVAFAIISLGCWLAVRVKRHGL